MEYPKVMLDSRGYMLFPGITYGRPHSLLGVFILEVSHWPTSVGEYRLEFAKPVTSLDVIQGLRVVREMLQLNGNPHHQLLEAEQVLLEYIEEQ